ncbi:ATP-binding cassette domain-containing protein [Bogoriella caseilytica]|uniref:Peptide/nickel transport system ATP-binding protein n=1 Tax=Bogoriella caseilytica TaxID=56055 RepID=A0A3N2B9R8_9MICO|nr:ABC transporter ATP-binding protein [Bogoriella caseilytica]ROR71948.1 peptide/nickel transport system ATP-binding protein [Bogoriella caseilytica]
MSLLEVRDLTVTTADQRRLLNGVSWEVDAGERLGVIGESGSGKSLTALAILGLLPEGLRATGRVRLGERELLGAPDRALRSVRGARIAMVFQEPLTALDPLMRVGHQLAGPLRLHRGLSRSAARSQARDLLTMAGLDETERVLRSFPWQLSGGQRQRVGIALALACEPEVLLADEPTTALDVTVQAKILELLHDLVEQTNTALVFISHDLPVVARLTEQLVVMRGGQVLEHTTVSRAMDSPGHAYTAELIDSARAVTDLGAAAPQAWQGEPDA